MTYDEVSRQVLRALYRAVCKHDGKTTINTLSTYYNLGSEGYLQDVLSNLVKSELVKRIAEVRVLGPFVQYKISTEGIMKVEKEEFSSDKIPKIFGLADDLDSSHNDIAKAVDALRYIKAILSNTDDYGDKLGKDASQLADDLERKSISPENALSMVFQITGEICDNGRHLYSTSPRAQAAKQALIARRLTLDFLFGR